MFLNSLLTIINLVGLIYLTFLVAKTRKQISSGKRRGFSLKKESGIQKIGLHRFNPFNELGGDQSFVLVLLDANNSGIIVTSLHDRKNTRIYSKLIKNGKADKMALSKEEELAIKKVLKISKS